jgi:sugar/nucleoside kinase (ribokinase family)
MQQRGAAQSEVSVIISDQKNQDHIILRTGDSVNWFDLDKALNKFREKADWIFVASQKNATEEKMESIVKFAEQKKAKLAINPSSYQIAKEIKSLIEYLEYFEILFINRDEAIEILQNKGLKVEDEPGYLLENIFKLGVKVVVVTDGANGAYVYDGVKKFHLGIEAKKIVDTVGAGDSFASGFLSSYIEDEDAKKGLARGIINSGSVVSSFGATNGLLSKKDFKKREQAVLNKIKTL